jgi:hypothetical protein
MTRTPVLMVMGRGAQHPADLGASAAASIRIGGRAGHRSRPVSMIGVGVARPLTLEAASIAGVSAGYLRRLARAPRPHWSGPSPARPPPPQSRPERLAQEHDPIAQAANRLRLRHDLAQLTTLRRQATTPAARQDADSSSEALAVNRRGELATEAAITATAPTAPSAKLIARIGPRPPGGRDRATSDQAVATLAIFHARHQPRVAPHELGPPPPIDPGAPEQRWHDLRRRATRLARHYELGLAYGTAATGPRPHLRSRPSAGLPRIRTCATATNACAPTRQPSASPWADPGQPSATWEPAMRGPGPRTWPPKRGGRPGRAGRRRSRPAERTSRHRWWRPLPMAGPSPPGNAGAERT